LRIEWNSNEDARTGIISAMKFDYSDRNPELGRLYARHVEALRARHDRALETAGAAHAVIFSGAPKYAFLDDNVYPFRANPHFVSWAPLTRLPHSYIVHTPGETPVLIYYLPHDYWHPVPGMPDRSRQPDQRAQSPAFCARLENRVRTGLHAPGLTSWCARPPCRCRGIP
jgi:hypothetical protein